MDDLHHRAPLVGAARSEVLDHVDVGGGRQRSVRFVRGRAAEIVEAVGEHADLDAGPLTLSPLSSRACCTCAAVAPSEPILELVITAPKEPAGKFAKLAKSVGADVDVPSTSAGKLVWESWYVPISSCGCNVFAAFELTLPGGINTPEVFAAVLGRLNEATAAGVDVAGTGSVASAASPVSMGTAVSMSKL